MVDALKNAFSCGFRSLYPELIAQLDLLLILIKGRQYPEICHAVAQQIAGVKSFSPVFNDVPQLGRFLPELLAMTTLSGDQLSSSATVCVPPTMQLLVCLETNLFSHVARAPHNKELTKLLMEHCADVFKCAAKQAVAIARSLPVAIKLQYSVAAVSSCYSFFT